VTPGKYTIELVIESPTSLDVIRLSHMIEQATRQIIPSIPLPVTLGEVRVLLPRAVKHPAVKA
jgi:hypothetical protein